MAMVEGVSGAGMTYQGSVSSVQVKADAQVKTEQASVDVASAQIAAETAKMDTKKSDADGGSDGGAETYYGTTEAQKNQIKKAVEEINKKVASSEAVFGIHDGTNRVTIKIIDKSTKEVIKELPPEKTLDMIAKVWEMAGLFVDERR